MQVTETLSQGLKREYDISLPASDLAAKLNGQLAELEGEGPHQRLPPRQGAGRAFAQGLRQVGDGRRHAGSHRQREQEDRRRQPPASRPRAKGRASERSGGYRRRARGPRRPQLQGRARGAAGVRDWRFLANLARAPDRRRRARQMSRPRSIVWRKSAAPTARSRPARRPRSTTASQSISTEQSRAFPSRAAKGGTSRSRSARTRSCLGSRTSSSVSPSATNARFGPLSRRLTPCARSRGRPPTSTRR